MKVSDRDTQVDNSLEMLQKELSRLQQEKLATEARLRLEIDKQKQQEAHSAKKAQTVSSARECSRVGVQCILFEIPTCIADEGSRITGRNFNSEEGDGKAEFGAKCKP